MFYDFTGAKYENTWKSLQHNKEGVHSTSKNKNNKRTHTSELDFKSEKHDNISEKVQQFLM
jgi:hypothetical protein